MNNLVVVAILSILFFGCSNGEFSGGGALKKASDKDVSEDPTPAPDTTSPEGEPMNEPSNNTDTSTQVKPLSETPVVEGCGHEELWKSIPIEVSTPTQFAAISSNKYYQISADLDLTTLTGPVGKLEKTIISGKNFTLRNFSYAGGSNPVSSLIPDGNCIILMDFNVENFKVSGDRDVSALAGKLMKSIVSNISVEAEITGNSTRAGMAIVEAAITTISRVKVKGKMTFLGGGGGLVAFIRSDVSPDGRIGRSTIDKSFADVEIIDTGAGSGGIGALVGSAADVAITNSSATGTITSPGDNIGGFIGDTSTSASVATGAEIRNCSFIGSVQGRQGVGGFAGNLRYPAVDSYAIAQVTASLRPERSAGFVGFLGLKGKLQRVYAKSSVGAGGKGLVGEHEQLGIIDSFWDQQACSCIANTGGTSLTTDAFKSAASFGPNWDFEKTWQIGAEEAQPKLRP